MEWRGEKQPPAFVLKRERDTFNTDVRSPPALPRARPPPRAGLRAVPAGPGFDARLRTGRASS